jgi:hypothetical protein
MLSKEGELEGSKNEKRFFCRREDSKIPEGRSEDTSNIYKESAHNWSRKGGAL